MQANPPEPHRSPFAPPDSDPWSARPGPPFSRSHSAATESATSSLSPPRATASSYGQRRVSLAPPLAPPPATFTSPYASFTPPAAATEQLPVRGGGTGARRGGLAVLAVAAVFASGVGGVFVGRELASQGGDTPVSQVPTQSTPGGNTAPVAEITSEPVAAVAASLSPAVVQLETATGLGSGFVYDETGLILTAAHVVQGSRTVTVRFADGSSTDGEVLGTDFNTDVAVVQVQGRDDLTVAPLALGLDLQVGQTAVAIGSPFGLDQTVTAGIVSAVGRATQTPGANGVPRAIPAIQTDAPINSGNSGGALADSRGRVIGINDSIITADASSGNVGVGFAIPIDIAKAVADRIVAGESTISGYLGVSSSDMNSSSPGAELVEVESGSPAADAGLRVGDVVVAFDGMQVSSSIDLVAAVTPREPGEVVTLTIERKGVSDQVEVTLGRSTR